MIWLAWLFVGPQTRTSAAMRVLIGDTRGAVLRNRAHDMTVRPPELQRLDSVVRKRLGQLSDILQVMVRVRMRSAPPVALA